MGSPRRRARRLYYTFLSSCLETQAASNGDFLQQRTAGSSESKFQLARPYDLILAEAPKARDEQIRSRDKLDLDQLKAKVAAVKSQDLDLKESLTCARARLSECAPFNERNHLPRQIFQNFKTEGVVKLLSN
ncbi:hypothetical protein B0H13DRAFT_1857450 [Mycena leptocephala]|nr:hypothetical protein B0H13DRAFT_1857450 [Mycena leptocephala]